MRGVDISKVEYFSFYKGNFFRVPWNFGTRVGASERATRSEWIDAKFSAKIDTCNRRLALRTIFSVLKIVYMLISAVCYVLKSLMKTGHLL